MNLTTVPASSRFPSDRKLDKRIDLVRGATSKSGGVQLGTAIAGGCAGKKWGWSENLAPNKSVFVCSWCQFLRDLFDYQSIWDRTNHRGCMRLQGGDLPHHQMGMNLEPMLLCWDPNSFGTHQSFRETPINFQRSDSWRLSQVQTFQGWQWLREWFVGLWHVVTEKHGNFHEMWEIKPSRTDCWFQKHVFLYFSPLSITTWDNHPNFGHVLDMGCVG
jgi:hypothetical protein